jgi:hypothetical protein
MIKKFLIALTFVSAFAFAGVGVPEKADAWRRWGWGGPYVTYYSAPPRAYYGGYYGGYPYRTYYGGYPYRTYYGGPAVYRSYYRPYYGGYYDGYPGYYYGPGPGVSVSVGF